MKPGGKKVPAISAAKSSRFFFTCSRIRIESAITFTRYCPPDLQLKSPLFPPSLIYPSLIEIIYQIINFVLIVSAPFRKLRVSRFVFFVHSNSRHAHFHFIKFSWCCFCCGQKKWSVNLFPFFFSLHGEIIDRVILTAVDDKKKGRCWLRKSALPFVRLNRAIKLNKRYWYILSKRFVTWPKKPRDKNWSPSKKKSVIVNRYTCSINCERLFKTACKIQLSRQLKKHFVHHSKDIEKWISNIFFSMFNTRRVIRLLLSCSFFNLNNDTRKM